MRRLALILFSLCVAATVRAAIPATKPTTKPLAKPAVSRPRYRAKPKAKPSASKPNVTRTPVKLSGRNTNSRRYARPTVARLPAPDRYQQIQRALAEKGYFQGQPDGKWGSDSVDALKRFQNDQNLTSDGKLNSLSLIALGLGPKRGLNAQATPPPTPPAHPAPADPAPGERP